jgi:parallel beta-helix repeat protein
MRTQVRRRGIPDFPYTPVAAAVALALAPQVALAAATAGCASGTTICVNDPGDSNPLGGGVFDTYGGQFDLRGALSNCSSGGVIRFDTTDTRFNPSSGPFVISISDDLPTITCDNLLIDGGGTITDAVSRVAVSGSSANASRYPYGLDYGFSGNPAYGGSPTVNGLAVRGIANGAAIQGMIVATENIVSSSLIGINTSDTIDGNLVFGNDTGIIPSSSADIQNNIVYNNTAGISAESYFGTIQNNLVGVNASGFGVGNQVGITLDSSQATISNNVISGNDIGIELTFDEGSSIESNFIGTDLSGGSLHANTVGILLDFSYGTSIGGNVIAAPLTGTAIDIEDGSSAISIEENNINTNAGGTSLLGGGDGVVASCSFDISVGDNLITAKGRNAVDFGAIQDSEFVSSIGGNTIGATFEGTALGSPLNGISLHDEMCSSGDAIKSARGKSARVKSAKPPRSTAAHVKWLAGAVETDDVQVGNNTIMNATQNGIVLDEAYDTKITGNTITGNAHYGVEILAGTGNVILDSAIYGNGAALGSGAKNIDLGFAGGPRPNDAGDVDTDPVPNDGQNYPSNIALHYNPSFDQTTISFTLDSQDGTYRIDIFENDPATTVPGGVPIANTFMSLSGGPASGSYTVSGNRTSISLTATALNSDSVALETSEFSPVDNTTLVPNATVTPTTVNFGNVGVDTDSTARSVIVRSTGTDTYVIGSIGDTTCYGGTICYGGAFTCSTSCEDGGYAPGQSCQITATFHPPSLGTFTQQIGICDNTAAGSEFPGRIITLTGTGAVPSPLAFTPSDFDFGDVPVGHTSPAETFTVQNPGGATISMGAFSATGDFIIGANTCGSNLAAGESCTVDVSFIPLGVGPTTGLLSVPTDSGAKPGLSVKSAKAQIDTGPSTATASATLEGNGIVQAAVTLPQAIDFGAYVPGTPPVTRTVTLTNSGNARLTFTTVAVSGPFTMDNGCGTSLEPGASCTITLTYSAGDLGDHTGTLNIATNALGGSGAVQLTGRTVAQARPELSVSPASIGFGSRMFATTEGSQRVTIKNIGSSDAALSPVATDSADFLIVGTTCGVTLTPGSTCFADVGFSPNGFGKRQGHLVVTSNAINNPLNVILGGTGCRPFSIPAGGASSCSP